MVQSKRCSWGSDTAPPPVQVKTDGENISRVFLWKTIPSDAVGIRGHLKLSLCTQESPWCSLWPPSHDGHRGIVWVPFPEQCSPAAHRASPLVKNTEQD